MKTITPNITEVARLAGVSVATVSRVLNENKRVREDTRKKVLEAVKKLGYIPNQLAANLRRLRTGLVLVVVPDIGNPFFSEIISAIERTVREHDYSVFVADTQNSVEKEERIMTYLRQREIDGAIFLTARTEASTFVDVSYTMPIVLACETLPGLPLPQVAIDNLRAAFDATEYLIRLGHRNIVHVKGFEGMKLTHDRAMGYTMAMESAGLRSGVVQGDFTGSSGRTAARIILEKFPETTAVFAGNDEMAMGLMAEFSRSGKNVPRDISVLGFDNISLGELYTPSLSTVHQPRRDIGELSGQLLVKQLAGSTSLGVRVLPYSIVERESTRYL